MTFRIIEIEPDKIGDCILNAFKYMVEEVESETRWFGANTYEECENWIKNYKVL
jgi:hypothetical protein